MWLPYPPYRETGMSGASWRPVMGFVFYSMFSFFQTIFQKISYTVASIAIAVGLVSMPSPPEPVIEEQPLATVEIQKQAVSSKSEKSEIEKLKKEVEELKKQQQSPKQGGSVKQEIAATQSVQAPKVTTKEENFAGALVSGYKKNIEDIQKFIEDADANIVELEGRKNHLKERSGVIRRSFLTSGTNIALTINEALEIYAGLFEQEVKYVDEMIEYVRQNRGVLSHYQSGYNRIITSLSNNPQRSITREEFIKATQQSRDKDIDIIYGAAEKIISGMKSYAENVIRREDGYERGHKAILNLFAKAQDIIDSSYSRSYSSSYQGLDASTQRYLERAERILNPVRCETRGDIIGGSYNAYTTCY